MRERQGDGESATGVKAARSGTVWDLSQGDHDDHDDDHDVNSDFDDDVGAADYDCEDGDGDVDDTWGKVPPLQNPFLRCPCLSQVVQQKN